MTTTPRQRLYMKKYYRANKEKRRIQMREYNAIFLSQFPEWTSWRAMNARCHNPKKQGYRYYGGRGIKMLYKSFGEFLLDVGQKPSPSHSIDRIDNNGHYEKGNCRWVTMSEQIRNQRQRFSC